MGNWLAKVVSSSKEAPGVATQRTDRQHTSGTVSGAHVKTLNVQVVAGRARRASAVSYTHLTLPTKA